MCPILTFIPILVAIIEFKVLISVNGDKLVGDLVHLNVGESHNTEFTVRK